MPTDTTSTDVVTQARLERDARILRESLTKCRRDVSMPLRDAHVRDLIKRVENDRAKPCEHVVTMCWDAFSRGAPREAVDGFFRAGLAMVGEWYDADAAVDFPALIRLETQAQAVADLAEIDLALDRSPKTIADATELLRGHLVALDRLVSACERQRFTELPATTRRMVA